MRTMATAAAIAKELSAPGVSPAYGLNCCAAAKMVGVSSRYFARPADEGTMKGVPVSCWPPVGDVEQVGRRNRSPDGFVETVKELASAHPSGEAVVMVSHREGIWEVLSHLHKPPTGKYCKHALLAVRPCLQEDQSLEHRGREGPLWEASGVLLVSCVRIMRLSCRPSWRPQLPN